MSLRGFTPRGFTPSVEQTISQMAKRVSHLETAEKWQLANIRVADHFAAQGVGTLGDPWSGPGDDNLSSPIQLAIDSLPAAGGVVYIKAGYYEEQDKTTQSSKKPIVIDERSNIILWAEKGAILRHTCNFTGGEAIRIEGDYDRATRPTTLLTVNASPGDWTITVANTAGFVVGDKVMLRDTKVYGVCGAGEVHRIRSIAAGAPGTITFDEPLWDEYLVARTAEISELYLCSGIQIHNLAIEGTGGAQPQRGILARYTKDLIIKNMFIKDCDYNGILIGTGIHPLVENTHVVSANEATNGAGIMFAYATQFGRVIGGSSKDDRHGISLSGAPGVPGRPRECLIDGFVAYKNINGSFDVHRGVDQVTFRDCVARHSGTEGFFVRGNTAWLENCKVVNGGGTGGIRFVNETDQPTNYAILGGSIECDNHAIRISESNIPWGGALGEPHDSESIRIEGVDMKPGVHGILIDGNDTISIRNLAIVGNTILMSDPAATGITALRSKAGPISANAITYIPGNATGIGIDLQGDIQYMCVTGNAVNGYLGFGGIGIKFAGSRNLIHGNNLFRTTAALSDVGVNNRTADNLLETGLLG